MIIIIMIMIIMIVIIIMIVMYSAKLIFQCNIDFVS